MQQCLKNIFISIRNNFPLFCILFLISQIDLKFAIIICIDLKMQNNEMQEQSESSVVQIPKIRKKIPFIQRDQSINFLQLAKLHLKQYQDINQDQFQLVQDEPQNMNPSSSLKTPFSSSIPPQNPTSYLKLHTTFMPIGTNFQTDIPDIMSSQSYLSMSRPSLLRIQHMKIHQPQANMQFYNKYKKIIMEKYGENRNYQEIACMKKCMELFNQCEGDFIKYINNPKVNKFWEDNFRSKDLEILRKLKKKKKKYKGSMDPS